MYGYQQKIVIILYLVYTKCDTYHHAPFIDPMFNETPIGHIIPVLHTEWVQTVLLIACYHMVSRHHSDKTCLDHQWQAGSHWYCDNVCTGIS